MLQYLDPYQYLHVYLRVSHTKNNYNTLGNVHHSKSRDNNFKLPPRAATCRSKRRHGRTLCRSRRPPLMVPQAGDPSRPPYYLLERLTLIFALEIQAGKSSFLKTTAPYKSTFSSLFYKVYRSANNRL